MKTILTYMQNATLDKSFGGLFMIFIIIGGGLAIFIAIQFLRGSIEARNIRLAIQEVEKYYSKYNQLKCNKCDSQLEVGSLFCSKCGYQVKNQVLKI